MDFVYIDGGVVVIEFLEYSYGCSELLVDCSRSHLHFYPLTAGAEAIVERTLQGNGYEASQLS